MHRLSLLFCAGLAAVAVVGCGDDDDDSAPNGSGDQSVATNTPDSGSDPKPTSGGGDAKSGELVVDGETYTINLDECLVPTGAGGSFGFSGTLEGEANSIFGGAGVGQTATLGIEVGGSQYVGAAAQLEINGGTISFDGELFETGAATVEASFEIEC